MGISVITVLALFLIANLSLGEVIYRIEKRGNETIFRAEERPDTENRGEKEKAKLLGEGVFRCYVKYSCKSLCDDPGCLTDCYTKLGLCVEKEVFRVFSGRE